MSQSDKLGMAWWNGMSMLERSFVVGQAERVHGRDVSAAECWHLWRVGKIRMDGRKS